MYGLSKKQKLKIVLEKITEMEISAYEIGKNTGLSVSGIDKIIVGTVKNPHETTLDKIIEYLESKVLGKNLKEENPQNTLKEEKEVNTVPTTNYTEQLIKCQEEAANMIREILYLQNILRKNNIKFDNYFEKTLNLD